MKATLLCIPIFCVVCAIAYANDLTAEDLQLAVMANDSARLKAWLTPDRVSDDAELSEITVLFALALENRKSKAIEQMLESGVQINKLEADWFDSDVYDIAKDRNEDILALLQDHGWSPVQSLSSDDPRSINELLNRALFEPNDRFLELCLDTGLSPDFSARVFQNDSLLNYCIKTSNISAFKILLKHGARINIVDDTNHYMTTLAIAVDYQGLQSEYVALLRQKGAYEIKYNRPRPNIAESTTDRLRIRNLPDLSSPIVGFLMQGDQVELLEVTPLAYDIDNLLSPWIRIRRGETQGWVFGGYLARSEAYGQSP